MTPKNFLNLAESNCINNGYIRIRHYFLKSFGRHLTRIIHDEDGADRPTEALTPSPLSPAKRRVKEGEKNKNVLHHFLSNLHKRRL